MWKYFLALCVLVAVCHVEGTKRGSGRRPSDRRKGIPANATLLASWVRVLPENNEFQESAYRRGDQVYVLSQRQSGRPARKSQFKPSLTVYDFSASPPMALLKVRRKCLLVGKPVYQSAEALISSITPFNGTRQGSHSAERQLFVTDPTAEQSQQLQSRAAFTRVCKRRVPMKALTQQQPAVRLKTVKVSGLDAILSISKVKGSRGRRNRKGGRGGRRKGRSHGN